MGKLAGVALCHREGPEKGPHTRPTLLSCLRRPVTVLPTPCPSCNSERIPLVAVWRCPNCGKVEPHRSRRASPRLDYSAPGLPAQETGQGVVGRRHEKPSAGPARLPATENKDMDPSSPGGVDDATR